MGKRKNVQAQAKQEAVSKESGIEPGATNEDDNALPASLQRRLKRAQKKRERIPVMPTMIASFVFMLIFAGT